MKTTILEKDGELVAVFEGRLDTAAAVETEQALKPLYDCTGHNIVFDCNKLEYISSSGLCLLLGIRSSLSWKTQATWREQHSSWTN